MTIKITAFQFINGLDEKRVSYTYSVVDDNGNTIKSNIRKSTVLKETDVEQLGYVESMISFLISKEQI